MAGTSNGARKKVLEHRPPLGPDDVAALGTERLAVLLNATTTEDERRVIEQELTGWEERPHVSALVDRLERRVVDPDDRWILQRARGFRILIPSAPPEPKPDPVLEGLILEQTARKVQAAAIADAGLDAIVAIQIELRKVQLRQPKEPDDVEQLQREIERIQAKRFAAAAEREHALRELDHETARLADLLQQRANRHRAFLVAHHIKT